MDYREKNCVEYYKECICLGIIRTMESFPKQHECKGFEFCRDIDETECQASSKNMLAEYT